MNRRPPVAVAAVLSAALVLSACGGGGDAGGGDAGAAPAAPAAEAGGPLDLAGAGCPATVVMQQDWQPEAEHGAMYALVGSDYTVDADAKAVKGSLVAQGVDTGVDIEVRPGGPNVGFQPVPALMYIDEAITLGAVNTEDAIAGAAEQPTVAVVSQMTVSPQILMWDPASHPGLSTIKDIAAKGVPVVTSGDIIPALLQSQGIIRPEQIDTSYEGTPARFVSDPTILQQGFATAESYIYENEISQWGRPIGQQNLADYGYSIYPEPLAVRADKLEELRPCLEKLVPIMQQSQIDYLAAPGPTNTLIVELVDAYQTGWTYSEGVAEFSARTQVEGGFVKNDPASGVFGQFDPARMQTIVDTFGPILQQQGAIQANPDPTELYTNDFIDPNIKMGS
ncbi:ABC transporter substrate-binding protein [Pseudonocardia humida]|uniref:ABC transporter substrate-binding protein n=1 Tax=Pseudonocardia humida TaxID=2800819 RepID=A0ABT1ABF6_9PSEU|nr:ABC transporter substrate-binding protein [Pseudonocardia humida]MCO1660392.1 ABC transporter substrate-binding protein [Pseudonocardia humida]